MSKAYNEVGEFDRAIEVGKQSLAIAKDTKTPLTEAVALLAISFAYESLGEYQKVIEFAEPALIIVRKIESPNLEAQLLTVLGYSYSRLGKLQQGIELVQQGLNIAKQIKNRLLEAKALGLMANIYTNLGEYQKALGFVQAGLKIAEETQDWQGKKIAQLSLIYIYGQLGELEKSLETGQQLLAEGQARKDKEAEILALFHLSQIYLVKKEIQKAVESTQQAFAIAQESKKPRLQAVILLIQSFLYSQLKNYEQAINSGQKYLAFARQVQNRSLEDSALSNLGYLYRQSGRNKEAIATYQQALAIITETDTANTIDANATSGLARIYRDLNQPTTAITYYKQAVNSIEQTRQKNLDLPPELQNSFLNNISNFDQTSRADIYRELANLLFSQGRVAEGLDVLDLLKTQEIKDFTKASITDPQQPQVATTPIESEIMQQNGTLIAFGKRVDECQKSKCSELNQLMSQRNTLIEQFNQNIQVIEKQASDPNVKDRFQLIPQDLQRLGKKIVDAQENTVFLSIFVTEDKIWLLWTSKGGVVNSKEVPVTAQKLGETVLKFRQLLGHSSSNLDRVKATSKQLYDWLVKPVEAELKANKIENLVFSLDRSARYIPVGALFDGQKYLIENYSVSTVLSAGLTDTIDRLPPEIKDTSVLGLGLSQSVSGYSALANVPTELDGIIKENSSDKLGIYPGDRFLDKDFDFTTLQNNLTGHKILHVATHGKFVPGKPDDSFIVLGTGEKLSIPKVKTLPELADVHLVVLSACQTAVGGVDRDGIEIAGISSYFLETGAKALIASLWVVADKSTSELMQEFYRNLAKEDRSTKAQALRQAQLSLLKKQEWQHPYYWAPFILIGNGL